MSKTPKILFVTLRSDFGGGSLHVDQLINNLSDHFDIYCAAPIEKPYGQNWFERFGNTKYLELPHRSFSVKYLLRLILFTKRRGIDVIHAHGKGAGLYARLVKIFCPGVYIIYTPHGLHLFKYKPFVRKNYILLERMLGKLTDLFINVSYGEKQVCLQNKLYDESKSIVIYNAIEKEIDLKLKKEELRTKLNLSKAKFLIVSVIRFTQQKNIGAILEIANKLADEEALSFLLIGDGEEKADVEKTISNIELYNVQLLGYKENINEYLHASDIFLSTSLWEGLPYSLIEAARAGLPIVASNVTGNNEVVINKYNGYLFSLDELNSVNEMILELYNSNETCELFGKNSQKLFEDRFVLDTMITKMKDVYSTVFKIN